MNNLSLFLWLSDVVLGVKSVFVVASIISTIGCLGLTIGTVIAVHDAIGHDDGFHHEEAKFMKKLCWMLLPLWLLLVSISVLIPGKDTILMIAASQAGEQIVTTPEAKQIMGKVVQVLNVQLDKLTKE